MLDLTDRPSLMASLPKGGIGAEVGVANGLFSEVLLRVCKPLALYLIDPWEHQTEGPIAEDPSNAPQAVQDARFLHVVTILGTAPRVKVIRQYSLDAAKLFADSYFDWWHLDGNHTILLQDLEAWWPKLKPGGYATGHDYTMAGEAITVKADVDKFVAERELELFVTRGDTDIYEKNYPTWVIQKPL